MGVQTQTFRTTPVEAATTQKIYNVTSPGTANVEFSQLLTTGTKQIMIRSRNKIKIQFTFTSGESGTDYITIEKNAVYHRESVNLTGQTIYMQVNGTNEVIEIEEWS